MEIDNYQKIRLLGEGTYGKCYLAVNKHNGQQCVLKQIEIIGLTQEQINQSVREAHILQALDSDFIIKFLGSFQSRDGYLNIIMSYAQGGDLSQKINEAKNQEQIFSQDTILGWFTQICLAIKHVHDRKIIHRDLKAQNIFLTANQTVKLGDFGIAKHLQHTIQKIKSVVGTPYYMSPQICQNRQYSFKADIWSLGVILLELCLLKPPFDANSLPVLALKISKCEHHPVPKHYSRELKKLISQLLQIDPARRPSIADVLKNPLIDQRISLFMPKDVRQKQFSHTTLHAINIFDKIASRGLLIDCNLQGSLGAAQIVSPKSLSQVGSYKNFDLPVKRVDNYMKDQPKIPGQKRSKQVGKASQPILTPKNHMRIQNERKLAGKGVVQIQKRKKESIFKKKSKNSQNILAQVQKIQQLKNEICGIQQQFSYRERIQSSDIDGEQINIEQSNILEEHQEASQSIAQAQDETLLQTLQKIILQQTQQGDLEELYLNCEANGGICFVSPYAGLITLAYGLKNEQQ